MLADVERPKAMEGRAEASKIPATTYGISVGTRNNRRQPSSNSRLYCCPLGVAQRVERSRTDLPRKGAVQPHGKTASGARLWGQGPWHSKVLEVRRAVHMPRKSLAKDRDPARAQPSFQAATA